MGLFAGVELVEDEHKGEREREREGEGGIQLGTGCRYSSGCGAQVGGIYCEARSLCTFVGSTLPSDISTAFLVSLYLLLSATVTSLLGRTQLSHKSRTPPHPWISHHHSLFLSYQNCFELSELPLTFCYPSARRLQCRVRLHLPRHTWSSSALCVSVCLPLNNSRHIQIQQQLFLKRYIRNFQIY